MQAQTIYQDIAKRTGGDIYIGDAGIIRLKIYPETIRFQPPNASPCICETFGGFSLLDVPGQEAGAYF